MARDSETRIADLLTATPLACLDYLVKAAIDPTPANMLHVGLAEANVRAVLEEHEEQRPRMSS